MDFDLSDLQKVMQDPEVIAKMRNPKWRIANLYTIVDRNARVIPFRLNKAQQQLLNNLHTRNIILKARQLGYSTLLQIAALDQALFNDNFNVGILAHTLDAAAEFLKRILFAYENLHPMLKMAIPIKGQNASMITFGNGSTIRIDTTLRGMTLQFLHVSEFGKICAKFPDKADEVVTGTLPALAPSGVGFIESTAEGRQGHFYRMCQKAEADAQSKRKLTPLDWKFHFANWIGEPEYRLDPAHVVITPEDEEYFATLETTLGVTISPEQRAWYVNQRQLLGDLMFQEFPSTPEEAFRVTVQGQWYSAQLTQARKEGRIGSFPLDPAYPVFTSWDIGSNDETAIWCFQKIGPRFRFIRYFEASGEPFNYFVRELQNMGYVWDTHLLPHDAEHKRQQGLVNLSALQMLQDLAPGWRFDIVPKIPDVTTGIQQARDFFSRCEFDEAGCRLGLQHLSDYRKEFDERHQVWRDRPHHGPESNGCFVAGTPVTLSRGVVPIESVVRGDMVVTPAGTFEVSWSGMTRVAEEILQVEFSDGGHLCCTGNHKILTCGGYKAADSLRPGSFVFLPGSLTCRAIALVSKVTRSTFRRAITSDRTNEAQMARGFCTDGYGSARTVPFRTDMSCTIRTMIRAITGLKTWSSCWPASIPSIMEVPERLKRLNACLMLVMHGGKDQRTRSAWQRTRSDAGNRGPTSMSTTATFMRQEMRGSNLKRGGPSSGSTRYDFVSKESSRTRPNVHTKRPQSGIEAQKAVSGIERTVRNVGRSANGFRACVLSAVGALARPILRGLSIVEPRVRRRHIKIVVSVRRIETKVPVYDLTVPGAGTYLAAGVVVSNSDAFRYAAQYFTVNKERSVYRRPKRSISWRVI